MDLGAAHHMSSSGSDWNLDSTDCAASASSGSPPRRAELPERVFANDMYPVDRKINSYSRMDLIIDILNILTGTPEYEVVVNSCFGSLFRWPARKCSLAGKLVHNFLSRQLHCDSNEEIWFTFAGVPLRFSVTEFKQVTGLPCGQYPASGTMADAKKYGKSKSPHWYTLIGPNRSTTISDIVEILKSDKTIPGWRRLQLVLVIIVDGVLLCGTWPPKPNDETIELVKDTAFFLNQYPWGRRSFEMTIEMIKVGKKVESRADLVAKLQQDSLVLHGCPIAIQLFLFQSVPSLVPILPHPSDTRPFITRPVRRLSKLRCYHTENILACENDPDVSVKNICRIPAGEYSDPSFVRLALLIECEYIFTKKDWKGGDTSLPKLCTCINRRPNTRCKCGSGFQQKSVCTDKHPVARKQRWTPECTKCDRLEKSIAALRRKMTRDHADLRTSIINEVRYMQSSRGDTSKQGAAKGFHGTVFKSATGGGFGNCAGGTAGRATHVNASTPIAVRPTSDNESARSPSEQDHTHTSSVKSSPARKSADTGTCHDNTLPCTFKHMSDMIIPGQSGPEDSETHTGTIVSGLVCSKSVLIELFAGKRKQTDNGCSSSSGKGLTSGMARGGKHQLEDLPDSFTLKTPHEESLGTRRANKRKSLPKSGFLTRQWLQVDGKKPKNIQDDEPQYIPFQTIPQSTIENFKELLTSYTQECYELDGAEIPPSFFEEIYKPRQWVTNLHIDFMLRPFWRHFGGSLLKKRICVLDSLLVRVIASTYCGFQASYRSQTFQWHSVMLGCIKGECNDRPERMAWFTDVDTVYTPMNWGRRHWVALAISLRRRHIDILDPFVSLTSDRKVASYMAPVIELLPHLINATCDRNLTGYSSAETTSPFTFERMQGLVENTRSGDCGALTVKFIEMHAHGLPASRMKTVSEAMVDSLRMHYAIQVYEEFVHPIQC